MGAYVVALLGAESTGKTTLALTLAERLRAVGQQVEVVPETLREFCDRMGRTPFEREQMDLAREHTLRIEAAAASADVVLADTTALMTAVYSDWVFADAGLYPWALRVQRRCDLNLVTAIDLPWQPDGIQRDGPQVREPVDRMLRHALQLAGIAYSVVTGIGEHRVVQAWQAIEHARRLHRRDADVGGQQEGGAGRWAWRCLDCDEPQCERHLFARL